MRTISKVLQASDQKGAHTALAFRSAAELNEWLRIHHAIERELWIRIFKKGTGRPTVLREECIVTAITWGWIDGIGKSLDDVSYIVRITPRRARSLWSRVNRTHAEKLIAEGRMRPTGLYEVNRAKADGRWKRAYSGSASMRMPSAFMKELRKNPRAMKAYKTLSRRERFVIYLSIRTLKRAATRERRIADQIAGLAAAEDDR